LRDGIESIGSITNAELLATAVSREELANPDYVKRAPLSDRGPMFDTSFFGLCLRKDPSFSLSDPHERDSGSAKLASN
jgi:acyl transferase domain-containing protein